MITKTLAYIWTLIKNPQPHGRGFLLRFVRYFATQFIPLHPRLYSRGFRCLAIKKYRIFATCVIILIISIPSFYSLINTFYFPMHDDQHIARLYLLDQALKQGIIYPRWVSILGFGYGYPLFNFYPPLIYYVSEIFFQLTHSYIIAIKLMIISGFIIGTYGMYALAKKIAHSVFSGFIAATIFNFFTYRATVVYVRGAFAEFYAISLIPLTLYLFYLLYENKTIKKSITAGLFFALIILTHPMVAFPFVFLLSSFIILLTLLSKQKKRYVLHSTFAFIIGLSISAFYWIPSLLEKKFTMVDQILLTELATYKIHFVYPFQLWYSAFGYGGSIEGPYDGFSFALGKIYIALLLLSFILFVFLIKIKINYKRPMKIIYLYCFALFLIFTGLTLTNSEIIWRNIPLLWYLQFPWRLLAFSGVFIPICIAFIIPFINYVLQRFKLKNIKSSQILIFVSISIIALSIGTYQKYFQPQSYINTSDNDKTAYKEIAWKVSRSSFEFVPAGIATTKSQHNTTIPDIDKNNIPSKAYSIIKGEGKIINAKETYIKRQYSVEAETPLTVRFNTFYFPGWQAKLDSELIEISNSDKYKLITVNIPKGYHVLKLEFNNTFLRMTANIISVLSFAFICFFFLYKRVSLK